MPKTPKSSAVEIAEEKKPGWKAVPPSGPIRSIAEQERDPADSLRDAAPAVPMPPTRQLQSKQRQSRPQSSFVAEAGAEGADTGNADVLDPNVELVDMKSGDIVRTFGVNSKTKKIDWSQG